ncbi:unnamed protein product, partial [Allacma fusca]
MPQTRLLKLPTLILGTVELPLHPALQTLT